MYIYRYIDIIYIYLHVYMFGTKRLTEKKKSKPFTLLIFCCGRIFVEGENVFKHEH